MDADRPGFWLKLDAGTEPYTGWSTGRQSRSPGPAQHSRSRACGVVLQSLFREIDGAGPSAGSPHGGRVRDILEAVLSLIRFTPSPATRRNVAAADAGSALRPGPAASSAPALVPSRSAAGGSDGDHRAASRPQGDPEARPATAGRAQREAPGASAARWIQPILPHLVRRSPGRPHPATRRRLGGARHAGLRRAGAARRPSRTSQIGQLGIPFAGPATFPTLCPSAFETNLAIGRFYQTTRDPRARRADQRLGHKTLKRSSTSTCGHSARPLLGRLRHPPVPHGQRGSYSGEWWWRRPPHGRAFRPGVVDLMGGRLAAPQYRHVGVMGYSLGGCLAGIASPRCVTTGPSRFSAASGGAVSPILDTPSARTSARTAGLRMLDRGKRAGGSSPRRVQAARPEGPHSCAGRYDRACCQSVRRLGTPGTVRRCTGSSAAAFLRPMAVSAHAIRSRRASDELAVEMRSRTRAPAARSPVPRFFLLCAVAGSAVAAPPIAEDERIGKPPRRHQAPGRTLRMRTEGLGRLWRRRGNRRAGPCRDRPICDAEQAVSPAPTQPARGGSPGRRRTPGEAACYSWLLDKGLDLAIVRLHVRSECSTCATGAPSDQERRRCRTTSRAASMCRTQRSQSSVALEILGTGYPTGVHRRAAGREAGFRRPRSLSDQGRRSGQPG